jgi:hypothetical protein
MRCTSDVVRKIRNATKVAGAADVEFLNREAGAFLDGVTDGGKKLN